MLLLPLRTPLLKVTVPGVIKPMPLKLAEPPEMISALLVQM
jgi:hypothetical protein